MSRSAEVNNIKSLIIIGEIVMIIDVEKLNKKQKQEYFKKFRTDWGICNPVTRKTKNKKAYNRKQKIDKEN